MRFQMIARYDKAHTFNAIKIEELASSAKKKSKLCIKMVNI